MSMILETKNLTYTYQKGMPDEKTAVRDISVAIEAGQFVGIIGHTGSGKSTFVQHLNGLLKPTSGQVLLDGQDIWQKKNHLQQVRFRVGLVFQYPEYQLFEETVYKDVAFGPKNMGLSQSEIRRRVHEAIQFTGMDSGCLNQSPFDLSGGEKRRVAIAGVLAMEPDVLILDEPTAGLDPAGRRQLLGDIVNYHKQCRNTVLIVSHSMDDVARYADRVMVINEGSLLSFDTVSKVFESARQLEEMGLAIPAITDIQLRLKARGVELGEPVYTVDEAIELIKRALPPNRGKKRR